MLLLTPFFCRAARIRSFFVASCLVLLQITVRAEAQEPPSFTLAPGFYAEAQTLEITHPLTDSGYTIHYTTDGSRPDWSSPIYDGPFALEDRTGHPNYFSAIRSTPVELDDAAQGWIPPETLVEKATVVRAVLFNPANGTYSRVSSGTYFIGLQDFSLPVISLSSDEPHFFGHETGIYVPGAEYEENGFGSPPWGNFANYFMRGEAWERPAHFEFFEQNERVYHTDIGVRIHGSGSRSLPAKSLRLYFRNDYGDSGLLYPVFGEGNDADFNRIILRNSGQDFYERSTMFRDAFLQRLANGLHADTQDYRPAVLFLNGEYWGIHNIRERYDKHYFERVYGVEEPYLDYLEDDSSVKEGSNEDHIALMDFLRENDLSDPEHYAYAGTQLDLMNVLDFNIFQIFIRNTDWPGNNLDYWRYNGPADPSVPEKDGRWRYLIFDTDFGFGLNRTGGRYEHNTLEHATEAGGEDWPNPDWATLVLRSLLENPDFRTLFIRRFSDLLNQNFRPDKVITIIDNMHQRVAAEMPRHIDRWQKINGVQRWNDHVDIMREFAEKRPPYQWLHIQEFFDLDERVEIALRLNMPEAGAVQLNTLTLTDADAFGRPWSGTYFRGEPLVLEANPRPGYSFSHWLVNGEMMEDAAVEILPESDIEITAHFEETEDYGGTFPAPHRLSESDYEFSYWAESEEAGSYPPSMAFAYMDAPEPHAESAIAGFTSGSYDMDSRTRINGLGDEGLSFLNTGNISGNPGYPGTRLGAALLALNTRKVEAADLRWEAGTVSANSRIYRMRLEYRVGDRGDFIPVVDKNGRLVEYDGNQPAGHSRVYELSLPPEALNQPYVQLMWRYYFSGLRLDEDSGQRSELRIGHIRVTHHKDEEEDEAAVPEQFQLYQNYPNPFNSTTNIVFELPARSPVTLQVYDIQGRLVETLEEGERAAGRHTVSFNAARLSSGLYVARLSTAFGTQTRKLLLLK